MLFDGDNLDEGTSALEISLPNFDECKYQIDPG